MDRTQKYYAGKMIRDIVKMDSFMTNEQLFDTMRRIIATPEQWEEYGDAFVARMMEEEEQPRTWDRCRDFSAEDVARPFYDGDCRKCGRGLEMESPDDNPICGDCACTAAISGECKPLTKEEVTDV
tara:strand:+ start:43 stop:420 length:378 start_codon:yes stop_codon:yes gene_type:complete